MIKITTPATSANIGVGFDAFGLALNLNNVYTFETSLSFKTTGFEKVYDYPNNRLITSYIAFSRKYVDESSIIPVHVDLIEQSIPISRGLGSSASVILAGVLAANEIHKLGKTLLECAEFASELEGHPDNVFACAFGGFTSSMITGSGYYHQRFDVSKDLQFHLLIPEKKASTKTLREVLPKTVSVEDAVAHLSRTIHVPNALKKGDLFLLKELFKDRIHEAYRYSFIPLAETLQTLNKRDDLLVTISGSGSSVLCISKTSKITDLYALESKFKIKKVNLSNGVSIEVILCI